MGSRKRLLAFGLLAVVGAAITYVVAFGLPFPLFPSASPGPVSVSLGSFTTNLDDPLSPHYIQVQITVLVRDRQEAQILGRSRAAVQSGILGVLRNQTYSGTLASEGMSHLGRQLEASLDRIIGRGAVEKVYFTSFLVQ